MGIFIFCSVFGIQRKFLKKDTKEIKEALGLVDVNLCTEDAKDTYASQRLLMHTSAVLDAALCDYHNIDLVLGQVAEWSDMVNIITTHHHDYKECICV